MIGIGITSLIIYVISIVILNVKLKRKMGEAMMWASLLLLIIGSVFGNKNFIGKLQVEFEHS